MRALESATLPDPRPGVWNNPTHNKVSEDLVTEIPVCLLLWNSRGSSEQKMQFLQKLVSPCIVGSKIPIICNQENFLLRSNSYKIFQAVPGFHFFIKPAVKDVLDRGRPKNGMFIGIPDSIRKHVKDVSPTHWHDFHLHHRSLLHQPGALHQSDGRWRPPSSRQHLGS